MYSQDHMALVCPYSFLSISNIDRELYIPIYAPKDFDSTIEIRICYPGYVCCTNNHEIVLHNFRVLFNISYLGLFSIIRMNHIQIILDMSR